MHFLHQSPPDWRGLLHAAMPACFGSGTTPSADDGIAAAGSHLEQIIPQIRQRGLEILQACADAAGCDVGQLTAAASSSAALGDAPAAAGQDAAGALAASPSEEALHALLAHLEARWPPQELNGMVMRGAEHTLSCHGELMRMIARELLALSYSLQYY